MSEHSTYNPGSGVEKWLDERLPIIRFSKEHLMDFPTPKNLNYFWTFGAILVMCLGIQIVTGKALGTHLSLEVLRRDFDAVYLAIGSWRASPMLIDGESQEGVTLGIRYLRHVTKGVDKPLGDTVVVIGGGNTAIDCVRTALRKGAARTVKALMKLIGKLLKTFAPKQCANYFRHAGYVA